MKRLLCGCMFFIVAMLSSNASASSIPLSTHSAAQFVDFANSARTQDELHKQNIYGLTLSRPEYYSYDKTENLNMYGVTVNGYDRKEIAFIFYEDSYGRIYKVACGFNFTNEYTRNKALQVLVLYLTSMGLSQPEISRIANEIRPVNASYAGSGVWIEKIGGYVIAGMSQIDQNTSFLAIYATNTLG